MRCTIDRIMFVWECQLCASRPILTCTRTVSKYPRVLPILARLGVVLSMAHPLLFYSISKLSWLAGSWIAFPNGLRFRLDSCSSNIHTLHINIVASRVLKSSMDYRLGLAHRLLHCNFSMCPALLSVVETLDCAGNWQNAQINAYQMCIAISRVPFQAQVHDPFALRIWVALK
jgi:hypothetical protein